jgi:hypothetical protein
MKNVPPFEGIGRRHSTSMHVPSAFGIITIVPYFRKRYNEVYTGNRCYGSKKCRHLLAVSATEVR